jgi:hypothetical protein
MELKKHREIKTDEQLRERTGLGEKKQKPESGDFFNRYNRDE